MQRPFFNYNGREYYTAASDLSAPEVQADMQQLRAMANADWPADASFNAIEMIIYINESGGIDGFKHNRGPRISSIEENLLNNVRVVSPAGFSGKAVPSWVVLTISPQNTP